MSKTKLMVLAMALVLLAGTASAQTSWMGDSGHNKPLTPPAEATESLFRGDLAPEIGIGCSNGTFGSGGPNDWAVGVTASLAPPFGIISAQWNMFSAIANGNLDFVAWAGGASPGAEIGRQSGLPTGPGNFSVAISPFIPVASAQFFFGLNEPNTNVGKRVGVDTNNAGGNSFIRAPTCGAGAFTTLTSLGFPGEWVMLAVIDDTVPVELQSYDID